jgi:protocatechuate 3,4-dioxygenase beta subunit
MSMRNNSRRAFVARVSTFLAGLGFAGRVQAAVMTPSATEGPFYPTPEMRTPDTDNDLVKIAGVVEKAGGEMFTLRGRITDNQGRARAGHRIEIWQCDMEGNYMHPHDRSSANFDPAFQGFGHDITDSGGNYVFRTIKPIAYPGRTPHIHVKVFDGARELLTTQFYVKGHPANAKDGIFKKMSGPEASAVSMVFADTGSGLEAEIDITV